MLHDDLEPPPGGPPADGQDGSAETTAAALWSALAQASDDGLMVVAPTGRILVMNRRFAEVWRLPDAALTTREDAKALAAASERVLDPEGFLRRVQEIYAKLEATHDEVLLRDGRVLDRSGTPLRDQNGRYLGWAWHFRDVTGQKAAEGDLRRLAETLQSSLLPPRTPEIPGLEVATRYRAASETLTVGGDFYDVFRLRSNDWGVVLGDVCGKGVDAARLTALARYSLRAAASHHAAPPEILSELNDTLLGELDLGERFASAIYGRLEQDVCGAWLTLSVGGHPLPIVVRRAGWIDVRGQAGTLLGLFPDIEVAEDRVGLGPGDAIVFCTDGVTEARNDAGEEYGDEALQTVLLSNTDADADAMADAVLEGLVAFSGSAFDDDVAILIIRVPADAAERADERLRAALGEEPTSDKLPGYEVGEPHWGPTWRPRPPREARMRLDEHPTSAARARHFVTGVLHSWRLSEIAAGDVELLTSELVGNAIRHGEAPFTVIVRYDGEHCRVEVGDGSPELPRRLQPGPDATGGRGIAIVEQVAARWGVLHTHAGKRVWFDLPAPPP